MMHMLIKLISAAIFDCSRYGNPIELFWCYFCGNSHKYRELCHRR